MIKEILIALFLAAIILAVLPLFVVLADKYINLGELVNLYAEYTRYLHRLIK